MHSQNLSRISELDALRGFAALIVVFFHYSIGTPHKSVFKYGVTGVDLFFIISGFVILMTLEKTQTASSFVVKRFARLFPTYWSCVTITTIALLVNFHFFNIEPRPSLWEYITNLTMIQKYFLVRNIDGSYWTLLVELLFYFYMLLIFLSKKLKHIERIGLFTLVPVFIYSTIYFQNYFPTFYKVLKAGFPLINHFPLFYAGIIFYKTISEGWNVSRFVLVASCYLIQLQLFDDGGSSKFFLTFKEYSFCLLVCFSIFTLFVKGRLTFIGNKITIYLGSISYSLYLIHQELSVKILIPQLKNLHISNFYITSAFALIIVIMLASLITYFIEKPSANFIRDRLKQYNAKI